jgi:ribosomal protein L37E
MKSLDVECLRCGERHRLEHVAWQHVQESECPRCGYLGWRAVEDSKLSPVSPLEPRRIRLAG